MRPYLEQHLRAIDPHGYLAAPNLAHHRLWDREAITAALLQRMAPLGMAVDPHQHPFDNEWVVSLRLASTAADGRVWTDTRPPPDGGPAQPLAQCRTETGQPGVVCWLKLCTLYPAWQVLFSRWTEPQPHWTPEQRRRSEWTVLEEADLPAPWPAALAEVAACCTALGMERFSQAELDEVVPFVTRSIWLAEDGSDDLPEAEEAAFEARIGFTPSRQQGVCCVEDRPFWSYS